MSEKIEVLICPFMSHRDGSGVPWPCVRGECACWVEQQGSPYFPQSQGRGHCGLIHESQ